MNRKEIVDLLQQFSDSLDEAWNDLGTLRRLSNTEVPNIFRGSVGLTFDVINTAIYPPRYLMKVAFGYVDTKIFGVSFRDGIIDIWIEVDPVQRFMYEIDLSRKTLRLWEYALLLLILGNKDFQEKMAEHISAVSITNAELVGVMQFLSAYKSQNSED